MVYAVAASVFDIRYGWASTGSLNRWTKETKDGSWDAVKLRLIWIWKKDVTG